MNREVCEHNNLVDSDCAECAAEYAQRPTHERLIILPSEPEIEQVACDEAQQDWDSLRDEAIYEAAFADGAKWMRGRAKKAIER